MKKLGILLLTVALLLGCTSCLPNYKEVKTDAIEPVGTVPEYWEEEVIPSDSSYYGTQVGNVLLYEVYDGGQTLTIVAYDVPSEISKTFNYEYKTEAYYLDGIYPAKDGNFYLLLTVNTYNGNDDLLPLIVKSDLNGNVLWETQLQNRDFATFTGLAESENGDIFAVGYTSVELDDTLETQEPIQLSDDGYNEYYKDFFGTEDGAYYYETQAYVIRLNANGSRILETAIEDNVAESNLQNAVYVENVGLITAYTTYNTDYEMTGLYALCLDETCKPVWKTNVLTNYTSYPYPALYLLDGQLYVSLENDPGCTVIALTQEGAVLWSQTYEDDTYATALTHASEKQMIISRTDECFTINATDGSIDRYLWEDEVGTVYFTCAFDDYYIVYSDHVCGGYYSGFIRMDDLYEYVYSAYDYDGNLLWRKGFTY